MQQERTQQRDTELSRRIQPAREEQSGRRGAIGVAHTRPRTPLFRLAERNVAVSRPAGRPSFIEHGGGHPAAHRTSRSLVESAERGPGKTVGGAGLIPHE
jgi:hypothetical protein